MPQPRLPYSVAIAMLVALSMLVTDPAGLREPESPSMTRDQAVEQEPPFVITPPAAAVFAFEEPVAIEAEADDHPSPEASHELEEALPPPEEAYGSLEEDTHAMPPDVELASAVEEQPSSAPVHLELALSKVADGLGRAVHLVPHPSLRDAYFVLRHEGTIHLTSFAPTKTSLALDLSDRVHRGAEDGLHSLVFHPRDPQRAFFFYNDVEHSLVLAEARLSEDGLTFLPEVTVRIRIPPAYGAHNGGALAFGPDGYLYVSVGDGGDQDDPDGRAQDLGSLYGKILRIDIDDPGPGYGVPATNPFVGVAGARSEIWAFGFRNPWRMSFDGATGDLWISDVGGSVAEEIDHHPAGRPAGANYGWRVFEGHARRWNDDIGETVAPVHEYGPTEGRCAIVGGMLYRGPIASLDGKYVYSDFCDGKLRALARGEDGRWRSETIGPTGGSVVQLLVDGDGSILLLHYNGTLHRYGFVEPL